MKFKNFTEYVNNFGNISDRSATTIKPFIKTYRQTYGEFQQQIYRSANYLLDQGVKKGDRVMVVASNCPEWQELNLGCQLIGATLVPVDARNSLETTLNFAKQTTPGLVFRGKYILPKLDKKFKTEILENYNDLIKDYLPKPPNIRLSGQENAVIIFTSGTTADPKGVVLTQQNLLTNADGVLRAIDVDPNWRILSILPLSHSYEFIGELCMMAKGVSVFYLPRITPLAIARALNDYKITILLAVPQLLTLFKQRIQQTAILEKQDKALNFAFKIAPFLPKKLKRVLFGKVHKKLGGKLEIVITGGAPIPTDVADFWERMGVRALQGYGLTETAPILTVNRVKDKFRDSQGLALYNVKLKVADDGEILAKGPNIFKEYWQNKAQTEATFTKDGWFKTGDMGKISDDGWLKIQGRAKFVIVLPSGMNVFPEDIEVVAEKHKDIKEICIVGVKKADGEEVFASVISDKNDKKINKAIKEINEKLEDFQHISDWARWPEEQHPRTLLLKIDRKNVALWANQGVNKNISQKGGSIASGDPLVNVLRLSLDDSRAIISEKDRLADVGIDSLRRLAVISLIEEQLGISIPESKIDKTTTLSDLRKLVVHGSHVESSNKRPSWQYSKPIRIIGNMLRETLVRGLIRIYVKTTVEGTENLAGLKQPAIFIFNHVDSFDAPVVYQSLPKAIRDNLAVAGADDMLVRHMVLTLVSRLFYAAFNLNRQDNILPSLEYTVSLLDKGWNIAIAPEGHVSKDGKLQKFKSGIGLLAVETGLPVVIVKTSGLAGTLPLDKKWPQHFSHVTVKIGQPIQFSQNTSYEKAAKQLHKLMAKL
ncbi:MAG: AMP-binding protein [Prolixibacteraceae bacterium]|nr:AMP-binding protein [Prolixibacteraceae bacterium]